MGMKTTFKQWMDKVDIEIAKLCGLTHEDLEDVCYADMFEDGYTPKQAARAAYRNSFY